MLRAGDMVDGRYSVIEQIAAGGMGTLWRAHHVELDVDVALKVLSVDAASPDALKRFKHEAQASARLRSPNIVHVLDYGVHDGQPYLAMELLRGEDLAARLARDGSLSVEETSRIIQAVARGMQLAHAAGVVHRDLKPANIFLEQIGDEQVVKILDFGVAKDLRPDADRSATTGAGVVGSPAYMSPEQVWGEKVDSRSDVWSMGVVVFEMLTGHSPFADETLAKVFEHIIRGPIPKVRDHAPALPSSLDAFFDKALARAPAERIASARELGDAFLRALALAEPPPTPALPMATQDAATPYSKTEHFPAPYTERKSGSSRRRAPLWLGLIAVVLLGAGLALRRASPTAPASQREATESRATAAPSIPESSTREAAPAAPLAVTSTSPQGGGSAAPPAASSSTTRPLPPRRPSPSTTAVSTRGADPTFGIPIAP